MTTRHKRNVLKSRQAERYMFAEYLIVYKTCTRVKYTL